MKVIYRLIGYLVYNSCKQAFTSTFKCNQKEKTDHLNLPLNHHIFLSEFHNLENVKSNFSHTLQEIWRGRLTV